VLDLGLTKLALIGGVALIVIGPERLPTVARVAGRLYGKLQGYLSLLKTEVNQQILTEKLKEQMQQQSKDVFNAVNPMEELRSVADDIAEAERDFSREIVAANRSFGTVNDPDTPLLPDALRSKQRRFQQKKRRGMSGPPVWFQRSQQRSARLISMAGRQARQHTLRFSQESKG
jgi:sec-independent protein translocase protein TatB